MKKLSLVLVLSTLLLATAGCTSSQELVKNQNQEIVMLQQQRATIIARQTKTAKEMLIKKKDLKLINEQIDQSIYTARHAQQMSNEQTNNNMKGALGGLGAILGTAAVIHSVTK
jgi:uncharacterized membrane protein